MGIFNKIFGNKRQRCINLSDNSDVITIGMSMSEVQSKLGKASLKTNMEDVMSDFDDRGGQAVFIGKAHSQMMSIELWTYKFSNGSYYIYFRQGRAYKVDFYDSPPK